MKKAIEGDLRKALLRMAKNLKDKKPKDKRDQALLDLHRKGHKQ